VTIGSAGLDDVETHKKGIWGMKRAATLFGAVLVLAFPVGALADTGGNGTTKDAIGWCVSAGNYNALQAGTTTGANRRGYAGQPGGVADMIADIRGSWCSTQQVHFPPPGQHSP
jgi:hypothetical protein